MRFMERYNNSLNLSSRGPINENLESNEVR